jgi:hypothetical protein
MNRQACVGVNLLLIVVSRAIPSNAGVSTIGLEPTFFLPRFHV